MRKPKHSEGPWRTFAPHGNAVFDKNKYEICSLREGIRTNHGRLANARLIAASPDMLEGLKKLLHEFEAQGSEMRRVHSKLITQCTKAIAKAEGRQS